MKIRAIACALALAATPVLAAEPEVFDLAAVGDWSIMLRVEEGAATECVAATVNLADDTVFGFRIDEDGTWAIHFHLDGRSMSERTGTLRLDVDYRRFTVGAVAEGEDIYIVSDDSGALFDAIHDGRAVALYSPSGKRIATASLKGSAAALSAFVECFQSISSPTESDPFI